ncbi:uncharacterized protein DS421_15g509670 [Arachis hypogaea]|nr:uncharacterized protein DS421_15g509670 [Arachis hypogaea]
MGLETEIQGDIDSIERCREIKNDGAERLRTTVVGGRRRQKEVECKRFGSLFITVHQKIRCKLLNRPYSLIKERKSENPGYPPPPPNGVSHCRRPWLSEASLFVLSAFSKSNPCSLSSSSLGVHRLRPARRRLVAVVSSLSTALRCPVACNRSSSSCSPSRSTPLEVGKEQEIYFDAQNHGNDMNLILLPATDD